MADTEVKIRLTADGSGAASGINQATGALNSVAKAAQDVGKASVQAQRDSMTAAREARAVMLEATYRDEAEGWASSRAAVQKVYETNDFTEGVQAFLAKRPPEWTAS